MGKRAEVKGLYYITHVENVPSILERGVLSHAYIESHHIPFKPIYDEAIVSNRKNKPTPDRPSLWEYADVYFQPRNPMMYRVVKEKGPTELAVIGITSDVLNVPEVLVTDGNAASHATQFYRPAEGLAALDRHVIRSEYWKSEDGSKRKIMAECLVPERIPPERIDAIYVADHETKERVRAIATREIHIIPEPHLFFTPSYRKKIGANITLVEGDMFFSEMQTLTVSVNLQGIMGKGLASRKLSISRCICPVPRCMPRTASHRHKAVSLQTRGVARRRACGPVDAAAHPERHEVVSPLRHETQVAQETSGSKTLKVVCRGFATTSSRRA